MHIVNAKPWTETLIAMIKFVLRNKIAGRVSVVHYTEFGNLTYVYFYIYLHNLVVYLADLILKSIHTTFLLNERMELVRHSALRS